MTFIQELKLIQSRLILKKAVFSSRPTDTEQHEYSDWVADDFERSFQDFRRHIGIMILISNPFSIDHTDAAYKWYLFFPRLAEHDLLNFYSHYKSRDKYLSCIPISHRMPGVSLLCSEALLRTSVF